MGQFFDSFVEGYRAAILFTSDPGEGLVRSSVNAESIEAAVLLRQDAYAWFIANATLLDDAEFIGSGCKWEQAGHDFWLTRNGHGCGFWDGDWGPTEKRGTPADWFPKTAADMLTLSAKAAGEQDTYVDDEGCVQLL
jgi:hypothetical protein